MARPRASSPEAVLNIAALLEAQGVDVTGHALQQYLPGRPEILEQTLREAREAERVSETENAHALFDRLPKAVQTRISNETQFLHDALLRLVAAVREDFEHASAHEIKRIEAEHRETRERFAKTSNELAEALEKEAASNQEAQRYEKAAQEANVEVARLRILLDKSEEEVRMLRSKIEENNAARHATQLSLATVSAECEELRRAGNIREAHMQRLLDQLASPSLLRNAAPQGQTTAPPSLRSGLRSRRGAGKGQVSVRKWPAGRRTGVEEPRSAEENQDPSDAAKTTGDERSPKGERPATDVK